MSSGSQIATYLAPESTPGETPDPATWDTLRLTGNTLTPNVSTEVSAEVRETRMQGGGIITSLDYSGDLAGEMSAGTFDKLLEAAFYGTWTTDVLEIGADRHTFTIVKAFKDVGIYSTFKGVHIGAMQLDIPEEGKVTCSFTGMGLGYEDGETDPTAAGTVNPQTTTVAMGSATSVGDILVDGATLAGEACISALSMSIDNTLKTQRCLGKDGPGALIATSANVSGSLTMAWGKAAWNQWKKMLTREAIGVSFPLSDAAGNEYTFELPEIEIDGELPDGGNEDIVQVTLNYTAKNTPIKVTRSLA
ncbi:phage tail tube protein [Halomonas sp. V046]|uniref:phage tail tube protein n=1 Tax=Halomonas sp. V046 TaxID=3459611 RepID=UPI0040442860